MSTPLLPKSKSSYDRSFDDMVDRKHLLFRLHSHNFCRTFFHLEEKVLFASLHCQKLSEDSSSEELSLLLTTLEKAPPSLTLKEDSEAVEKHITSWCNKHEEPSNYISLTFNVLYVLWIWKRKRRISSIPHWQSEGCQDDFRIIVLNSSKLRASRPLEAKLGTQLLSREKHKDAYRFAQFHHEVIVAKYIQPEVTLGSMSMSRLEDFIPSWCQKLLKNAEGIHGSKKLKFSDSLPPLVDKVDCAMVRESLRFSLALLAPMLVSDEQQRANIGSGKEADCGAIGHSRTDGMSPMVEPTCGREMVLVSGPRVTEDGYVYMQSLPRN
ncbi:hypothetical protein V8E52_010318 [Russula decolorans]|jgi:hypothetical protein